MVLGISHCVCLGDSWQCLTELLDVSLGMILPVLPLLVSDQVREEAQNGSQLHAALPVSGIRSKKSMPASGSVPGLVRLTACVHRRSESAFEKANVDVFRVRTNNVGLIYKIR